MPAAAAPGARASALPGPIADARRRRQNRAVIDALILDYGGVVIHEDPADYDPIGRPLGFADGQLWALVHGIPEYRPSRLGHLTGDEFEAAVRERLLRLAGLQRTDAVVAGLLAYYRAHEAMRPAMRALLPAIRTRVKTALLSNAARGSTAKFARKVVARYFDAIVCSGDVGVAKPDPASFRLAAQRLAVPVERCAVVDDVRENVLAARALGMAALHYHHARHADLVDALREWRILE